MYGKLNLIENRLKLIENNISIERKLNEITSDTDRSVLTGLDYLPY